MSIYKANVTARINPVAVIASGVLISVALFYILYLWQVHTHDEQVLLEFRQDALTHVGAIRTSLKLHMKVADTLATFYKHASQITREEFHIFAGSLAQTSPSMQALEWIPKVSAAERQAYEQRARKTIPGFRFTELDENGRLITAAPRDNYYPVYFLEPYRGNEEAAGFDLGSEPMRRNTMDLARDSAQVAMSGLITLVQEKQKQKSLLTFLPIYQDNVTPINVAQRRQQLKGFVLAICHIDDMFKRAITQLAIPGVDIWIFGHTGNLQEQLFLAHTGGPSRHPPTQGVRLEQTIEMAGYQWKVILAPALTSPGQLQAVKHFSWRVLLAGLLVTGLIGWHLHRLNKYALNLQESNRSLDHANTQLRSNEKALKVNDLKLHAALEKAEIERSRLEDAIESIDAIVAIYDAEERLIICNQKYHQAYHEVAHLIVPGAFYKDMLEEYYRVTKTGIVTGKTMDEWVNERLANHRLHKRNQIQKLQDRWLLISDYPTSEGGVVSLRYDITSSQEAEAKIQSFNRTYRVLSRSNRSMARAVGEDELLRAACKNVVIMGGYNLAWVGYVEPGSDNILRLMAKTGDIDTEAEFAALICSDCDCPYPGVTAINTGNTEVIHALKHKPYCQPWKEMISLQGYESMIALALKIDDKILGSFNIFSTEKGDFTNKEEVSLLEELADNLSLGIKTMRERVISEQNRLLFKNEIEQDERKRIAATLHDGVAQTMQAVNLGLKSVRQMISNEQQQATEIINRIIGNTADVIDELRHISHDLRPIFLERMGLEEAIQHHCKELNLNSTIRCQLAGNNQRIEMLEQNKEQSFLSFREALNNAIRHARATRIEISMNFIAHDSFSIQIRDNGVGFNTDDTFQLPSGLGLSMISERMQSIGGHAEIQSSPGAGTLVTLVTPAKIG